MSQRIDTELPKYPLLDWNEGSLGFEFGEKSINTDFHLGIDHMRPKGQPIYAWEDNLSVSQSHGNQGGNTLHIRDNYGKLVRILHLSRFGNAGKVQRGDIIGEVGSTGLSTGPHTHIDVSINGRLTLNNTDNFFDPMLYFKTPFKVLVVANNSQWVTDKMLQPVQQWFPYRIDFDVTYINQQPSWWNGSVNRFWWQKNIAKVAKEYDCVIHVMPPEWWKRDGSGGYSKDKQISGLWRVEMKAEENGRRQANWGWQNDSELLGRIRHELCHVFYDATKIKDKLHQYEYTDRKIEKVLPEINWEVLNPKEKEEPQEPMAKRYAGKLFKNNEPPVYHSSGTKIAWVQENTWNHMVESGYWNPKDIITIDENITHDYKM